MAMFRSCAKCGKIHASTYICQPKRTFRGGEERKLRSQWSWTEKSREIREKAHHLCEVCKDHGQITYNGLEVHHIVKLTDDKDGLLDDNNLICLCVEHHKQADKGEIDVDYLKRLAEQRETGDTKMGNICRGA